MPKMKNCHISYYDLHDDKMLYLVHIIPYRIENTIRFYCVTVNGLNVLEINITNVS